MAGSRLGSTLAGGNHKKRGPFAIEGSVATHRSSVLHLADSVRWTSCRVAFTLVPEARP